MGKKDRRRSRADAKQKKSLKVRALTATRPRSKPVFKKDAKTRTPEKNSLSDSSTKYHVKMANPKLRRKPFGLNKRRTNPELSEDDSLPSESDADPFDSDEDVRKAKKQKIKVDSDSEIDEFLNEDEDDRTESRPAKRTQVEDSSDDEEPSDDDEREDVTQHDSQVRVSIRLVAELETALKEKPTPSDFKVLVRLLSASVSQAMGKQQKKQPYLVEGSLVFNAIISTCLKSVEPALQKFFKFGKNAHSKEKMAQMKKNKSWKVLHVAIRNYLTGLTSILTRLQQESIVRRVLRHIKELLPYYSCNPKASKGLFKHLIQLWATGTEKLRLSAFMTLFAFIQLNPSEWVLIAMKKMYVAYVSNSRITTSNTWPSIGFMASSLVEVLSIKPDITYQQAFIYIRQMAIHVRNATNQKNKEMQAKVYNWPFMHCIYLWSKLVGNMSTNAVLAPLAHPLIQVILSTIKINPVRKYYPMMFHCVRALNMISGKSDLFIPTIPLLLTALQARDLNKKPKTTSFKPFDFMSMLKFSESQLSESAYRTGIADQVYELFVEHIKTQYHRIGYPELMVIPVIQMKTFLKESHVAEVGGKFRSLVTVVEDQSRHIKVHRKNITFKFNDSSAVATWEKQRRDEESPFTKFYKIWKESRKKGLESVQSALDGRTAPESKNWQKDDIDANNEDADESGEDIWLDIEKSSKKQAEATLTADEEVDDVGDTVKPMEAFSDESETDSEDED